MTRLIKASGRLGIVTLIFFLLIAGWVPQLMAQDDILRLGAVEVETVIEQAQESERGDLFASLFCLSEAGFAWDGLHDVSLPGESVSDTTVAVRLLGMLNSFEVESTDVDEGSGGKGE